MSKRFTHNGIVIVDHLKKDLINIDGDENLLDLAEYVDRLQYENEQLKQELSQLKNINSVEISRRCEIVEAWRERFEKEELE